MTKEEVAAYLFIGQRDVDKLVAAGVIAASKYGMFERAKLIALHQRTREQGLILDGASRAGMEREGRDRTPRRQGR